MKTTRNEAVKKIKDCKEAVNCRMKDSAVNEKQCPQRMRKVQ